MRTFINVVKGVEWEEPNQLYNSKKSIVYEFSRTSNHYLMLGEADIESKENSKKISVKVVRPEGVALTSSMKAHVFAANFIPSK